jgi:hypothetical protein
MIWAECPWRTLPLFATSGFATVPLPRIVRFDLITKVNVTEVDNVSLSGRFGAFHRLFGRRVPFAMV